MQVASCSLSLPECGAANELLSLAAVSTLHLYRVESRWGLVNLLARINVDNTRLLRRCVDMALAGIHREFPCQIPLMLDEPTVFRRPRDWTPVFYGCYDWHSAVHSHWLLVRWLSIGLPEESKNFEVRAVLADSFTADKLAAEYQFLSQPNRSGFERPYGLAWLLQLFAELRRWRDPIASSWLNHFLPLEQLAVARFREWLPRLPAPVRTGEHNQTAFSLSLVADWARDASDLDVANLVNETVLLFFRRTAVCRYFWNLRDMIFCPPRLRPPI